jgi:cytochrome b involved in lipid metabolism
MSESLTTKQVAEHASVENGLYIIIDNDVYKMDSFVDEHPGGAKILKRVGGKDASKQFWKVCYLRVAERHLGGILLSRRSWLTSREQYHNESVLKKYAPKLKVGTVKEEAKL